MGCRSMSKKYQRILIIMSEKIYAMRYIELEPEIAAKIFPFVNAYRPHDPAPTWREFREDGVDRIEEESLMDIIVDQYEAEAECYGA